MFTLRLLGGLRLENPGSGLSGRATQRVRLAILALLALSPDRRITRDRLIALLWPEASAEDARRRLSSALYDLRRVLGDHALGGPGEMLFLDESLLAVDVDFFRAAVKREAWIEAAQWYQGPLLDGIHLPGSVEFEEWLTPEREQLHRVYLTVLERQAAQLVEAGRWTEASALWSRLVSLEPLTGRWTLELMRAMVRLEDRGGALKAAERFQTRLHTETGMGPDPAVAGFASELRATRAPVAPPPLAASAISEPLLSSDQIRLPRRQARTGVAFLFIALIGLLLAQLPRSQPAGTAAPLTVAVLPFTVTGDSALRFLRDGMVDLLSANLEGVGTFGTVDPHALLAEVHRSGEPIRPARIAQRFGALRYLAGTVYGRGDSLRIQATLHDAASGRIIREVRATGSTSGVPSLVDRLTAQLAAGESGDAGNRIASVAALTTLSIPALRDFLSGEHHFREGRFGPAVQAYRRAVTLDTTFALAHYRLSLATIWGNEPAANTEFHDSLALHHATRLSPRDRSLVEAYVAWRKGRGKEAWRRYDELVARYPDDVEAWYQRGEAEFHYGPQLGQRIANSRVSFERVVALDSAHWGARWHLALLDAKEGRRSGLQARVAGLLALHPDSSSAAEMQLIVRSGSAGAPTPRVDRMNELVLFGAGWRRAVFLEDLEGARELFHEMARPGRTPYSRQVGVVLLGQLDMAEGRWRRALEKWDSAVVWARYDLPVVTALIPGFERSRADWDLAERRLREGSELMGGTLRTLPEIHAGFQRMRALLAAAQGDTATALSVIRVLDTLTASPDDQFRVRSMAETVRAYMAYRAGQYQTALDLLERRLHTTWPGFAVTSAGKGESFERFLRAEVLRQLQRPMEALGWYASFDEHAVHDLMYLAPALLRSAELNRSLGRPQLAAEQLGRAARLWQGADPEFRLYLARQVRIDGDPPASEPE